jgi:hypothetical protein
MWVSRAEMRRLVQQLAAAEKRALRAEDALAAERQRHDWKDLQLLSRAVTKSGGYGLEHEQRAESPPPQFIQPPTPEEEARRDYYVKCYLEAGRSAEEAEAIWEAERRGEVVRYPYEDAELTN